MHDLQDLIYLSLMVENELKKAPNGAFLFESQISSLVDLLT